MFKRTCTILLAPEAKAIASVDRAAVRLATLARRRNEHASTLTLTYDEQGEKLSGFEKHLLSIRSSNQSNEASGRCEASADSERSATRKSVFGKRKAPPAMPQGWNRTGEGL